MKDSQDIKVFVSTGAPTCNECGQSLGRGAWITLAGDRNALCLSCADLDHLHFLPTGDAALTRRARKHSTLSAVVLKWSRARRRYERQGVLVEEQGLERAEDECLADGDARERRRQRQAQRRIELDREYVERFAMRFRELFVNCPAGVERAVAEHACLKYSGRVGRSAAAKDLDERAVRLAVAAHVRHLETPYDQLLASGRDRHEARRAVQSQVHAILSGWQSPAPTCTGAEEA